MSFQTLRLDLDIPLFDALAASVEFEDVTRGRKGNHLVDVEARGVPIVRTTTQHTQPAHVFSSLHHRIVEAIRRAAEQPALSFNNALIEIYERSYAKMGYHSDQALDLQEGSCIALFSCYERPDDRRGLRMLKIKDKTTGAESAITLEHHSVVLWSLETNTRYAHKIVLDPKPPQSEPDNRWLGLTLRHAQTYLHFRDGQPCFADGTPLKLADEAQRKQFYQLRGQENRSMDFTYPALDYTISLADTLEPIKSSLDSPNVPRLS